MENNIYTDTVYIEIFLFRCGALNLITVLVRVNLDFQSNVKLNKEYFEISLQNSILFSNHLTKHGKTFLGATRDSYRD